MIVDDATWPGPEDDKLKDQTEAFKNSLTAIGEGISLTMTQYKKVFEAIGKSFGHRYLTDMLRYDPNREAIIDNHDRILWQVPPQLTEDSELKLHEGLEKAAEDMGKIANITGTLQDVCKDVYEKHHGPINNSDDPLGITKNNNHGPYLQHRNTFSRRGNKRY